jgi:LysM repeat protein
VLQVWLKGSGGRVRIPVLPAEYTVTSEQDNTSVTVCNLGEVTLRGKRKLQQISFSSFFPAHYDSSYCDARSQSPISMVKKLEKMKRGGRVKLIITGVLSMKVTIESFEWGENDGTGDISYSLSLKEYRTVSIPSSVLVKEQPAQPAPAASDTGTSGRDQPEATSTQTYTVKSGDTLSGIARKMTGSTNWQAIYQQNQGVIGSNPNLIKPGQVLTIPGAKS